MVGEPSDQDDVRRAWTLYAQWKTKISSVGRQEVLARQERAARDLLVYACAHVPLWRRLISGKDPRRLPWHDVPTVDRGVLVDCFRDTLNGVAPDTATVRALFGKGAATSLPTGQRLFFSAGKTAKPVIVIYDARMWQTFLGAVLRRFRYTGLDRSDSQFRLSLVGTSEHYHTLPRLRVLFPRADVQVVGLQHGVTKAARDLNEFQPDVLLGFSSAIALMVEAQVGGIVRIKPKHVFVGTDALSGNAREIIERVWSVQPFDAYACTEAGIVAFECPAHQGMHVNEDLVKLETSDDKVIVTNLVNRIQPIIRCVMPDAIQLDPSPCACGLPYIRLRTIEGRASVMLELPGQSGETVKVHPIVIRSALDPFLGTVGPAVSVHANTVEFEIHNEVDIPKVKHRLSAALRRAGVNVRAVQLRTRQFHHRFFGQPK